MSEDEPKGKKLSSKYKMTTRTTPGLMKVLEEFVRRAALDHDKKFRGRRVSKEHLIPIAVLVFLDRPPAEQLALYDRWGPIYGEMVDRFESGQPEPEPLAPPAAKNPKPKK